MIYKHQTLENVLELHKKWIKGNEEGCRADLSGANLQGADLSGLDLFRATLRIADLSGANLRGSDLSSGDLSDVNLFGADLTGTISLFSIFRRADLSGADLSGADLVGADFRFSCLSGAILHGANLRGTTGNCREIKSLQLDIYPVTYTYDRLQIGCENHAIEDWWEFDDEKILEMDGKEGLNWWRKFKPILQNIIETSPAIATGKETTK